MSNPPPAPPEPTSDNDFQPDSHADDPADEPASRSQRKREAEQITRLGETISELSESDLQKLPLDERVRAAVNELRKIRSFGARKRQLLYLGKVLRKTELAPIHTALKAIQLSANAETRLLHNAEQWRDRLLAEGDPAIDEFIRCFASSDRQHIRQLVRNHRRELEQKANNNPASAGSADSQRGEHIRGSKAAREVFKLIRSALSDAADQ